MSVEPSPIVTPGASTEGGGGAVPRRARRSWTSWEDQTLRSRIAQYGESRGMWKEISQAIPGRTAKACRKRWLHSLDPSLRKGRWTEDEDRILLDAYARLGPAWNEIANLIPGRKDDQCSKRHRDILDPLARNRLFDWTAEEDQKLRDGVKDLGHRWTAVAARLPGRPPLTCRNRWRHLGRVKAAPRGGGAGEGDRGLSSAGSGQPTQESDTGLSASPAISREGDTLDASCNFQDPVAVGTEAGGVLGSVPGGALGAEAEPLHGSDYTPLAFGNLSHLEGAVDEGAHAGLLNTPTGLDGLPNMDFEQGYWDLGSGWEGPASMANAPNPELAGQPPVSPHIAEPAVPQSQGHMQSQQAFGPGSGSPADPADYRALELEAEMASRSQQGLANVPEEVHNPGVGVPTVGVGMDPLYTAQSDSREFPRMVHHHHHHG